MLDRRHNSSSFTAESDNASRREVTVGLVMVQQGKCQSIKARASSLALAQRPASRASQEPSNITMAAMGFGLPLAGAVPEIAKEGSDFCSVRTS